MRNDVIAERDANLRRLLSELEQALVTKAKLQEEIDRLNTQPPNAPESSPTQPVIDQFLQHEVVELRRSKTSLEQQLTDSQLALRQVESLAGKSTNQRQAGEQKSLGKLLQKEMR